MALKGDGTLWAWGRNDYGQLGDGTTIDKSTPVQVSGLTNVVAIAVRVVSHHGTEGRRHSLGLGREQSWPARRWFDYQ